MNEPPYRSGHFVWSAYPERETPARPGPRHIGYVVLTTGSERVHAVFLAYTTSRPWTGPTPPGLYTFDRDSAAAMGQPRPFTLDLRRMAAVPVTAEWFPDLKTPDHGIVGRAPEWRRVELEDAAKKLFRRSPEIVERLGPLWPSGQR